MSSLTWIASYPKSGNTWTRFLLASYFLDGQVDSAESLDGVVPDISKQFVWGRMLPIGGDEPVVVKTHFLPGVEVLQPYREATGKAIYLVRNPRDVILSSARHLNIQPEKNTDFATAFIEKEGVELWAPGWGTWTESVRDWTSTDRVRKHFPNIDVLPVKYEDMREDTAGGLQRILEFLDLGVAIDQDRVRRAVENSSIKSMRTMEKNASTVGLKALRWPAGNSFVGKGLQNQSLADFGGEEVEAAYQRLLAAGGEFSRMAERFGYTS